MEFCGRKFEKCGFLCKRIEKFGVFIEESALPMSKIKQIVGATEGRWDYIFYRTD